MASLTTAHTYTYNPAAGTGGGPYAVRSTTTNGVTQNITYDGNGNMTNYGGRTLTWSADNQPIQANNWPVSEDYAYDADGERVKRSNNNTNVDTFYIGGLFEQDAPSNTTRIMYTFGGQVIAQRTVNGASNTLIYLHSDHLGSVSAATSVTGAMLSRQQYDPWGKVYKQAGTSQTKVSYTGQKLDDTGLLYYGARYYDPQLARFMSPDTVIQGSSPMMVGFHEMNTGSEEGGKGGPLDPQSLNRYSYTLNNPLKHTDASGHQPAKPPLIRGNDVGDYKVMLRFVYNKIHSIVGGGDQAFNSIKVANFVGDLLPGSGANGAALLRWSELVHQDGVWDLKSDLREMYGSGSKNLYFDAYGKKDVAFSIFGNILFGYVGLAAGFSEADILTQNGLEDFAGDDKGVNEPDFAAIRAGFELWKNFGANMTMDQLDEAIRRLIQSGDVHTRTSVNNGSRNGCGVKQIPKCAGGQ